jgi:predicted molibdopterin-dependent oxidoreductase YjgC
VHEALAKCPFVVVQEVSADTDTAAFADLLLPAAGWGEKEGTVTNSERRISARARGRAGAGRGAGRLAHRRRLRAAAGKPALSKGGLDYAQPGE